MLTSGSIPRRPGPRPTTSRRFGPLAGVPTRGLTVQPDVSAAVALARNLQGFFRKGAQQALLDAHREMAQRVQQYAVEELTEAKKRSGRPQRPDSLLTASIRNARNRFTSPSGFQVGLEDWLFRQSPAKKYARRIEMGGANPMARMGPIVGYFWYPTGTPSPPMFGSRAHGRLAWRTAGRTGNIRDADAFVIRGDDIVDRAGGYRMHTKAGQRFLNSRQIMPTYRRHFAKNGLNVDLISKEVHGRRITNRDFGGR